MDLRLLLMATLALTAGCAQRTPSPGMTSAPPRAPAVLGVDSAQHAAVTCARSAGFNVGAFIDCTREQIVLSPRQQAMVDCAMSSQASKHFAECAAPQLGIRLDRPQIVTADCALQSRGVKTSFIACAGTEAAGKRVTPRQQAAIDCAAKANDDVTRFTACAAQHIIGARVSREQRIALACAAQEGGNYAAFTTCAGANFFNVKLSPDQTVAVECIVQVGGIPSAAVGCMAVRFMTQELRSCASKGFGGAHGCFGDDNAVIGRNGWTMRKLAQLDASRPAMMASVQRWSSKNAFIGRARSWWQGTGAFVHDPASFWRTHAAAGGVSE